LPERIFRVGRRLLGASTPLVLARLTSALLTFGLPLLLARVLTPAAYGTYKQFFLVALTVLYVMQLGIAQSLYYFLPRRDDAARAAYLPQSSLTLLAIGIVSGVVLWALAPSIAAVVGDGALGELRLPLALYAALMLASSPLEPALTASGRITGSALCLVLTDAVRALALTVAATHLPPPALFWAAVVVALLRTAGLWALMMARVVPAARPSLAAWRRQLAYAVPFGGAMVLYIAQRYCAQYVVSARFDTATFALFTVAAFHLPILTIVFTSVSEVLMVRMSQSMPVDPRRALQEWQEAVAKLAAVLFPVACGAWLVGGAVLPLLFTWRYAAAVPLFLLATCEIPIWIYPCDALLRTANDTRFMFALNALRVVVTIAFVLGGIALFSLAGAIVGALASETLARAAFLTRGRRFLGASWRELLHADAIRRTAGACALAYAPARAVAALPGGFAARVALPSLVFGAIYLALMVRLARVRAPGAPAPAPLPAPATMAG
jgi:O-antigen/teichoic acid export membrane protein